MAMQNIYNYKKPANLYHQKKDLRAAEPIIVAQKQQPKNNGDDYLEQKIFAAKPEELTLMLYDGILRFLKQAKLYMEQKNYAKTHYALVRAQDIIDELNITLDMSYDMSQDLRDLYIYMRSRLVEANLKKNQEIVDEVLSLSTELRDTWKEAMGRSKIVDVRQAE